jgi:hypothetical protein
MTAYINYGVPNLQYVFSSILYRSLRTSDTPWVPTTSIHRLKLLPGIQYLIPNILALSLF